MKSNPLQPGPERPFEAWGEKRLKSREETADQSGGYSLTSRRFSLSTGLFSLDFSWRRVDVGPEAAQAADSDLKTKRQPRTPPDAHEMRRRLDLARLLEPAPQKEPGAVTIYKQGLPVADPADPDRRRSAEAERSPLAVNPATTPRPAPQGPSVPAMWAKNAPKNPPTGYLLYLFVFIAFFSKPNRGSRHTFCSRFL